jgi:hypothetical protein
LAVLYWGAIADIIRIADRNGIVITWEGVNAECEGIGGDCGGDDGSADGVGDPGE